MVKTEISFRDQIGQVQKPFPFEINYHVTHFLSMNTTKNFLTTTNHTTNAMNLNLKFLTDRLSRVDKSSELKITLTPR